MRLFCSHSRRVVPLSHSFARITSATSICRIIVRMDSKLTIVFEPAEEGGYTAFIPEVPGAISEGDTVDEARELVLDALNELTAYRRDTALRSKGPETIIERITPVF